jgi:hypothetical protein
VLQVEGKQSRGVAACTDHVAQASACVTAARERRAALQTEQSALRVRCAVAAAAIAAAAGSATAQFPGGQSCGSALRLRLAGERPAPSDGGRAERAARTALAVGAAAAATAAAASTSDNSTSRSASGSELASPEQSRTSRAAPEDLQLVEQPQHEPAQSLHRPRKRPLASYKCCAPVSAALLRAYTAQHGSSSAGVFTAGAGAACFDHGSRRDADVAAYQAAIAARLRQSPADVCWLVQSRRIAPGGAPLAFSATLASPECVASFAICLLLNLFEAMLLSAEVDCNQGLSSGPLDDFGSGASTKQSTCSKFGSSI